MNWIVAVILGLLQGIFEWMPVSSEGIITLFSKWVLGVEYSEALYLALFLHLGTLISVLVYFRKDLIEIISKNNKLILFIPIITLLSGSIGIVILFALNTIEINDGIFTIIIGLSLLLVSKVQNVKEQWLKQELNLKDSIILGIIQGFSIIPGISRSGVTISTLLFRGYKLETALRISFIISIPIVIAVNSYIVLNNDFTTFDNFEIEYLIALVVSAVVGYITLDKMMSFVKKFDFSIVTFRMGLIVLSFGIILILFI